MSVRFPVASEDRVSPSLRSAYLLGDQLTTHPSNPSLAGRLLRELELFVVGLVTIVGLFMIAVYTLGWAKWVGYSAIGLGLITIALRVPVAPRHRALAWLVAGTGTA